MSVADLKGMAALPPGPENMMKVFLAEVSPVEGSCTRHSRRQSRPCKWQCKQIRCLASDVGLLQTGQGETSVTQAGERSSAASLPCPYTCPRRSVCDCVIPVPSCGPHIGLLEEIANMPHSARQSSTARGLCWFRLTLKPQPVRSHNLCRFHAADAGDRDWRLRRHEAQPDPGHQAGTDAARLLPSACACCGCIGQLRGGRWCRQPSSQGQGSDVQICSACIIWLQAPCEAVHVTKKTMA